MAVRVLPVIAPFVSLLFISASVVALVNVTANCTLGYFSWTFNSVAQSPCMVAGYMLATCLGGSSNISPLPPGWVYTGPYPDSSDPCQCSTIVYSLLSACARCQGRGMFDMSIYMDNCTSTLSPAQFPNPVPSGTYVPYWATLDIANEDIWDANASYRAGDNPEYGPGAIFGPSGVSTIPPSASSSVSKSYPSASFNVSTSPPCASFTGFSSDSGGKSSNVGAVVGAVVGGIAAISIAVATIFYLRRRRRRAGFAGNGASQPISNARAIAQSSFKSPPVMKLYNPDDPTTFPGYQGDQRPSDILSASQGPSSSYVASSGDTQTSLSHAGYHGLPMPMG